RARDAALEQRRRGLDPATREAGNREPARHRAVGAPGAGGARRPVGGREGARARVGDHCTAARVDRRHRRARVARHGPGAAAGGRAAVARRRAAARPARGAARSVAGATGSRREAAMSRPSRRRLLGALGVLPVASALPGCVGLGEAPAHVHYELEDRGPTRQASGGAHRARTLLVAGVAASAFEDGTGIAYSRSPGARAHYQFASWTERPAGRIARLLVRRLAAGDAFGDVAMSTAPVRGDWLLELQLEQMFHDDVSPP